MTRSDDDGADWQLAPASPRARAWLFALAFLLPVALVAATLAAITLDGGGESTATGRAAADWLLPVGSVAVVSGLLWAFLDRALRRHRLELDDTGLLVRTTFYTRRFAIDELRPDQARNVVLAERPGYRPAIKTNGFALPGFSSGWFRLRDGGRALVATTGGPRAVWLPTTRGHGLLLEPRQPQALLDRLRALADVRARR